MTVCMDYTVNGITHSLLAMTTMVVGALAGKLRATVDAEVPQGYEDESGFHFGTPTFKN
jgi:hypothetical protein